MKIDNKKGSFCMNLPSKLHNKILEFTEDITSRGIGNRVYYKLSEIEKSMIKLNK
jgi:hypothetical protein